MIQVVMVILLTLAVIAIAIFISLEVLSQESIVSRQSVNVETAINNETIYLATNATEQPTTVDGLIGVSYQGLLVTNETGGELLESTNWTLNSNGEFTGVNTGLYNNTNVNVSASSYKHTIPSQAVAVANYTTGGTTLFFANIPTIFLILGAVVIILAVTLILFAVNKFGASSSGRGGSNDL